MKKTERLFNLIEQLRGSSRPATAASLARELGVSERTIYRDTKLLISQGLPITGEAGIGYVLEPHFNAPPIQFTADELDILSIGLRIAFREGDQPMRRAAETAFAKIRTGLKDKAALDSIDIYAPGGQQNAGSKLLSTLRVAIRNKSIIRFDYLSLAEDKTQREIKPLALLFFRDATLLSGYCMLRQDFRNFRIDRISTFVETGKRFTAEHYALRKAYFASIKTERSRHPNGQDNL